MSARVLRRGGYFVTMRGSPTLTSGRPPSRVLDEPVSSMESKSCGLLTTQVTTSSVSYTHLERLGWQRPNAHGSMFVWVKLPGGRTDSMAFCEELMERAGVIVTPGASFGPVSYTHLDVYKRQWLVTPRPNTNLVGEQKVKLFTGVLSR